MLAFPVTPLPLELNMFCLSQLDYVLGKRGGSDLPSHCGGRSGSLLLGRACHAQCYTELSFLCPVLFFGYGCKDGLVEYLLLLTTNADFTASYINKLPVC